LLLLLLLLLLLVRVKSSAKGVAHSRANLEGDNWVTV
jgi:hypothetical protein